MDGEVDITTAADIGRGVKVYLSPNGVCREVPLVPGHLTALEREGYRLAEAVLSLADRGEEFPPPVMDRARRFMAAAGPFIP